MVVWKKKKGSYTKTNMSFCTSWCTYSYNPNSFVDYFSLLNTQLIVSIKKHLIN